MIGQPITATAVQLIQVKASGNLSTAKGAVFANDDDGGMVDAGVSNFDHNVRLAQGSDIARASYTSKHSQRMQRPAAISQPSKPSLHTLQRALVVGTKSTSISKSMSMLIGHPFVSVL